MLTDDRQKRVHVEPLPRRHDQAIVEAREARRPLELGCDHLWPRDVSLGHDEQLEGSRRGLDATRHPLVPLAHGLRGVNEERHDVHVGKLGERGPVELLAKSVLGLV